MRGFEVVKDEKRKHWETEIQLPTLGTEHSAAYDLYAPANYFIPPFTGKASDVCKIWTDVKAYMQEDEVLEINVRSSQGGKLMLANTQGWVDADYYENESNDGNIGVFLINMSNKPATILKGERIAQCMFVKTLRADNIESTTKRVGGFGSTNK